MQATLSADALGHGRPTGSTGEGSGSARCLLSVGGSDTGGLQPGSSGAPRRRRHGARRSPQHTLLQFRYYFRNLRELVVPWTARQSLSGQAPLYLADDWRLVSDSTRRSLRSADVSTCVVPPTLSSYGDRTFAAAGPRLWNSLPVQLRNSDNITYGLFRRQLKGHLLIIVIRREIRQQQ